jgi:hypothetical protein
VQRDADLKIEIDEEMFPEAQCAETEGNGVLGKLMPYHRVVRSKLM